jgi:hypothetical protein
MSSMTCLWDGGKPIRSMSMAFMREDIAFMVRIKGK